MVAKMKEDSSMHERGELASIKRRDADEKKEAFNNLESRTQTVAGNLKILKKKIGCSENDYSILDAKAKSIEAILAQANAEVASSDRAMQNCRGIMQKLKGERASRLQEQPAIEEKVNFVSGELQKAKKALEKIEKECPSATNSLHKAEETYEKYLRKISSHESAQTVGGRFVETLTSNSPAPPTPFTETPPIEIAVDGKFMLLEQDIKKKQSELQGLQDQAVAAQQLYEAKRRELTYLQQQASEAQQRVQQIEHEIMKAQQDSRDVEMQNHKKRNALIRYQSDIDELEKKAKAKQAEISKLNDELKNLNAQFQKQIDTLNAIRSAWEQAEREAQSLEASIQNGSFFVEEKGTS
jgi:chromosome segregation ATPase